MTRKMKDSGIEWIGEIPEDWEVTKLKRFVKIKSGDALDKKKFIDNGDIEVYGANAKLGNYDKSNIDKESIITGRVGTIGTLDIKVNVWITDNVLAIDVFNANLKFIYYFLHILNFGELSSSTAQPLITATKLLNINIAMPNSINQHKISNYLDKKTKQIEDIKNKISEEIENLENYKKSVITEAVTKGLDKNVEMKDSGIEWIGEIPKYWEIGKTLFYLKMPITDGPHTTPTLYDEGVPFVSAEAVASGKGKIDFNKIRGFVSEEFYLECCKKYIPEIDDVYMIKSGATTGLTAIVDTNTKFTIWSPLAVFRADISKVNPKFLFYVLQSKYYLTQVELYWNYGTQQNIGMRTLEKLKICAPPMYEQEKIVRSLDKEIKSIDEAIESKQKQLEILKEYKKSLIYGYVTGKKEVKDGEET